MFEKVFEFLMWMVCALLVLIVLGLFIGMGYMLYEDHYHPAPSWSISKASFDCTQTHVELIHGTILVGKVIIPTTNSVTVCDQYTRKH